MSEDIYPLHKINHKGAVPVKIGGVELGESQLEHPYGTQPNPIKISWSRSHDVKVHSIPYPAHKTIRTSKRTLYKLQMSFKTLRNDKFDAIIALCEACGPHWIETATRPSPMWMYITDFSFDQNEGFDDDYIEWSISFQEVND